LKQIASLQFAAVGSKVRWPLEQAVELAKQLPRKCGSTERKVTHGLWNWCVARHMWRGRATSQGEVHVHTTIAERGWTPVKRAAN
jgi:hypothetical protein